MFALSTEGRRGSLCPMFAIPTVEVWFVYGTNEQVTHLSHFAIQPRTSLDSSCVQIELFDINQTG